VSPLPSTDETKQEGSPHSLRYVLLRLLAALAIAGAFFAIDQIWIEDDPLRDQFGASVKSYEIESEVLERTLPAKVVVPPQAPSKDRSLLVFLHGRGEDERSYLDESMFEALADQRGRAPVVAFPFGGDSSYWHDRDSGDWASYVLDEFIPQVVVRYDIDPDRIAIGGIAMGGYGAFNIARLGPDRFCAVGGHSPAIWESAGEAAPGAFDDEEDFEANDVIAAAEDPTSYEGLRLWLDATDDDPFLAGNEALEEALRESGGRPVVKRYSGGRAWDDYFQFYAHALNECKPSDPASEDSLSTGGTGREAEDSPGVTFSPPSDKSSPRNPEAPRDDASGAEQP